MSDEVTGRFAGATRARGRPVCGQPLPPVFVVGPFEELPVRRITSLIDIE